jgi:uncharacterized membrane protein YjjB (DUF3815 family)
VILVRLLDLLAAETPAESVDVLVTWVGAATLLRYRVALGRRRERSALERRTGFLISCMALLLLVRGFSWLNPDVRWLGIAMLLPATLLPLAMTLFTEGLLRRHVPRWTKWLAVGLTATAATTTIVLGVAHTSDARVTYVLLAALLTMMGVLGVLLARRDKGSLSRSENGLVRACLLVTLISLPLVATDFRFDIGWPMSRLGTLGALLFCYTLLRQPQEHARVIWWARDVGRLLLRAAVVCLLLLVALRTAPRELLVPLFVLATALVIAVAIADRLAQSNVSRTEAALLRWLARPPATTLHGFVRELHHLPLTADALIIEQQDLAMYDRAALCAALATGRPVHSLARLREERAVQSEGRAEAARGADQLTDLLERAEMTHVALLTTQPLRLLLANIPELPGAADAELALGAVVRHGQLAVAGAR